ncbi:glycine oxidase ThiO [Flexivirga sp. ID2601S]|uniref:glycine oxidase n=1 Tax=Flexivirga aerilata TaxID=1656889 RepID=A0A849AL73_9MICO|nr:glycine oxidase ThiO [Flexivirga aerilata]NNG41155.1 glycine oxidase ThiO [Flexivirga aerilata]
MTSVAVLGGGVIGLSAAWELARRGADVVLVDVPLPGRSSPVAAGMISAAAEVDYGETGLWELTSRSQAQWPGFAADLERAAGRPVGLRRTGTLLVATDRDEQLRLERRLKLLADLGVDADRLDRRELRRKEPALAPSVRGAAWLPDDLCVERGQALAALRAAVTAAAVRTVEAEGRVLTRDGRAVGVELADGLVAADHVVLCGGWRSAAAVDASAALPDVRPVKGELIDLELPAPAVTSTVRAVVDRVPVYLVPHDDTRLTVGATSTDVGADTAPTVRAALELLSAATTLVPELRDARIAAHRVGLRPASADNHPSMGVSPMPGLILATGHYRHGFLLAPLTASIVADSVMAARTEGDS